MIDLISRLESGRLDQTLSRLYGTDRLDGARSRCSRVLADLTGEYAAITQELKAVCRCFGKEFLRDVPEETFLDQLPRIRREVGDRAVLRALHVYGENRRAAAQALALKQGDFQQFLNLVRESGRSSAMYLQNLVPAGQTARLKTELADLARALTQGLDIRGDQILEKHADWAEGQKEQYTFTPENAMDILQAEVGKVFAAVLEHAGVYKCTKEGRAAFLRFLSRV